MDSASAAAQHQWRTGATWLESRQTRAVTCLAGSAGPRSARWKFPSRIKDHGGIFIMNHRSHEVLQGGIAQLYKKMPNWGYRWDDNLTWRLCHAVWQIFPCWPSVRSPPLMVSLGKPWLARCTQSSAMLDWNCDVSIWGNQIAVVTVQWVTNNKVTTAIWYPGDTTL